MSEPERRTGSSPKPSTPRPQERGKLAKIERLAGDARAASSGRSSAVAARLLSGSPFAEWEQPVTSVGWATVARAAVRGHGMGPGDDRRLRRRDRRSGRSGRAAPAAGRRPRSRRGRSDVARGRRVAPRASPASARPRGKQALGSRICSGAPPRSRGSISSRRSRAACASARTSRRSRRRSRGRSDADREAVARARRDCGDIGETAVAARDGRLDGDHVPSLSPDRLHARDPDRGSPRKSPPELPLFAIEDKFDGIRAHAHKSGSAASRSSRGRSTTSPRSSRRSPIGPRARSRARSSSTARSLAWRTAGPDSFFRLQRRLGRKAPAAERPRGDSRRLHRLRLPRPRRRRRSSRSRGRERRRELEEIAAASARLHVSEVFRARDAEELDRLFDAGARARQRRADAQAPRLDLPGRQARPRVAQVEEGARDAGRRRHRGRAGQRQARRDALGLHVRGARRRPLRQHRQGVLGPDRRGDPPDGDPLSRRSRPAATARCAPSSREVVLEVAFDSIQKSTRHKSGFALRFPRIVRLRPDKPPAEATSLEEVRQLYENPAGSQPAEAERPSEP